MTGRRRLGHLERVALCGAEPFAEYTRLYSHCFAAPLPEGEAIARRIARKHCAGMAGPRPTGAGILAAIARPPDPPAPDPRDPAGGTARPAGRFRGCSRPSSRMNVRFS